MLSFLINIFPKYTSPLPSLESSATQCQFFLSTEATTVNTSRGLVHRERPWLQACAATDQPDLPCCVPYSPEVLSGIIKFYRAMGLYSPINIPVSSCPQNCFLPDSRLVTFFALCHPLLKPSAHTFISVASTHPTGTCLLSIWCLQWKAMNDAQGSQRLCLNKSGMMGRGPVTTLRIELLLSDSTVS